MLRNKILASKNLFASINVLTFAARNRVIHSHGRSALHVKQYSITPGPCRSGVSCLWGGAFLFVWSPWVGLYRLFSSKISICDASCVGIFSYLCSNKSNDTQGYGQHVGDIRYSGPLGEGVWRCGLRCIPPPINYLIIKGLAARGAAIGRLLALPPWHMLCAQWVMPFLCAQIRKR